MRRGTCEQLHLRWAWIAAVSVLIVALATPHVVSAGDKEAAMYHNQKGLDHFNLAFYEHTPKKKDADASQEYTSAAAEFRKAIAEEPSLAEPHRNLARLTFIQRDFATAAEEYRIVTDLDPSDLDAYVNLSLARVELGDLDGAITALEGAKTNTSDQKALSQLDRYIAKVRQLPARKPAEVTP
jgi:tetratricopeptide (TPR) repeat protein